MKYAAETMTGKTVTGTAVRYEGFDVWIVNSTPTGCSQTKVKPETVKEVEE